jgi:serine/threonine-protein kinase HipA
MPRRTKSLGVWLDGQQIATLEQRRWPEIRCRYTELALESWPQGSPVISCSLRVDQRPQQALAFCKGLLPEGHALQALADRAGIATNDTFALLGRYGRDVAGALVIASELPDISRFGVERYTDETLERAVNELDDHPLGAHDDSELSLAGLQDKILLVRIEGGGWGRPLRGRPSTHILKVDDARHPGLVAAEAQCLRLATAVGLTTIEPQTVAIGSLPCLVVSRFDRATADGRVRRVHQEDLCQATAIDPDANQRRAKYQRAGGPSLAAAARLLDAHGVDPAAQLDRLVAAVTFTVAIGNADAHGKNVALLHPDPESVELAPLYDTVPTVLWPKLRTEPAMQIADRREISAVTLEDIAAEAGRWGHSPRRAHQVAAAIAERLHEAVEAAIHPDHPVAGYVRERVRQLTH